MNKILYCLAILFLNCSVVVKASDYYYDYTLSDNVITYSGTDLKKYKFFLPEGYTFRDIFPEIYVTKSSHSVSFITENNGFSWIRVVARCEATKKNVCAVFDQNGTCIVPFSEGYSNVKFVSAQVHKDCLNKMRDESTRIGINRIAINLPLAYFYTEREVKKDDVFSGFLDLKGNRIATFTDSFNKKKYCVIETSSVGDYVVAYKGKFSTSTCEIYDLEGNLINKKMDYFELHREMFNFDLKFNFLPRYGQTIELENIHKSRIEKIRRYASDFDNIIKDLSDSRKQQYGKRILYDQKNMLCYLLNQEGDTITPSYHYISVGEYTDADNVLYVARINEFETLLTEDGVELTPISHQFYNRYIETEEEQDLYNAYYCDPDNKYGLLDEILYSLAQLNIEKFRIAKTYLNNAISINDCSEYQEFKNYLENKIEEYNKQNAELAAQLKRERKERRIQQINAWVSALSALGSTTTIPTTNFSSSTTFGDSDSEKVGHVERDCTHCINGICSTCKGKGYLMNNTFSGNSTPCPSCNFKNSGNKITIGKCHFCKGKGTR